MEADELDEVRDEREGELFDRHAEYEGAAELEFLRENSGQQLELLAVLAQQHLATEHQPSVLRPRVPGLDGLLLHQEDGAELAQLGDADEEFVRVLGDQEVRVDTGEEGSLENSVGGGHSLPSTLAVRRPRGTAP